MPLGVVDDIGTGQTDIVQVSVDRTHPDPALTVLAEGRDQIVGERGVVRVVIPEHQVPDLPAQAVSGGGKPEAVLAVDEYADGGGRDGGGRGFYAGEIGDLERLPLEDGQSFRFQSDPELPVPGDEAPHHVSREEGVSKTVGMGSVVVERMFGGMVEADSTQRSDDHLSFRGEAQARDLVIRQGVPVGFGMKETFAFSRGDVHPEQPLQRSDPHLVPRAQKGCRLIVFSDVDAGENRGLGQPSVREVPDFEEVSAQGDPRGSVLVHVLDPGHEAGVRDVAMQGVYHDPAPLVGESYPEQVVVGYEPHASVGVPVHVSRGMRVPPGPGHARKRIHEGKGLQVDDVHAACRGNP